MHAPHAVPVQLCVPPVVFVGCVWQGRVFDTHTPLSLWKLAVHVPIVQVLFEHIAVPFVVLHLF